MQKSVFIVARYKINDCPYKNLNEYFLSAKHQLVSGDGTISNPYQVKIYITNNSDKAFEGIVHVQFPCKKSNPRFYLPGFMYGRNRGEAPVKIDNKFPRLREQCNEVPISSYFMVRGDRLSHPCAAVYDSGHIFAFHTSPYLMDGQKFIQYGGYSCNLCYSEDECSVGFTFGYENAPWLLIQSHNICQRQHGDNYFTIKGAQTICKTVYIYDFDAENLLRINDVVESVYDFYHEEPRKASSADKAIEDLATAVCDFAYLPDEKNYSGFVREKDGVISYNKILSISWTNGIVIAVPQLMASHKLKNKKMLMQALEFIENTLEADLNEKSGLLYDACGTVRGWWFDGMYNGGHASYMMGQFVYYLLKGYVYEKQAGFEHPDWLTFRKMSA